MAQETIVDEQTGIEYPLKEERKPDMISAGISIGYSILVLIFLLWLLFDVWYKDYKFIAILGYAPKESLMSPFFRLLAFTFIGGCLGGTVASIRGIIFWHCENRAFGARFIYKHLSLPWIGGALALFIFALVRSGIGILGGEFTSDMALMRQTLSSFAIGGLSGYGSRQVYKWFDSQVNRMFQVALRPKGRKIPDLTGKTRQEAEALLQNAGLKIGKETGRKPVGGQKAGMIVEQNPKAGAPAESCKEVDITITA